MQPHRFLIGATALVVAASIGLLEAQAQTCPPDKLTVTQMFSNHFGPLQPPWVNQTTTVPQFHPGPGETLLKAEITIVGSANGSVQAENLSTSGGHNFVWSLGSALQVQIPVPGQQRLALAPSINGQDPLSTFDGNLDFLPSSGASHMNLSATAQNGATYTDPAVLQNVFTGPGDLTFTHSATDTSFHTGGGNLAIVILNQPKLDITVTYTICAPIPPSNCNERNRRNCGSLLLFPEFDNSVAKLTLGTVTNACCDGDSEGTWIEFRFINKDNCQESNFSTKLSPCDTFTFAANFLNPNSTQGYLYVYAKEGTHGGAANPGGEPWVFNRLIGQELILDAATNLDYSMNAVAFKGIGDEGSLNDDDGDGIRDLNGPNASTPEYEEAPDEILIPRFLGQDLRGGKGAIFNSQLILIALSGGAEFTTVINVLGYNDNEDPQSSQYAFHCWAKPLLREVAPFTLESYLESLPTNSPFEIDLGGGVTHESGWLRINGLVANSAQETIHDPAIYAVLVERFGPFAAADLPYELCSQTNGDLLPMGVFGDGPNPLPDDDQ